MREGYIWNGADDNASGTVGVMTIARAFTAAGIKPKKTIIFAAWTGEEEGLLGSKYFVDHPPVPLQQIVMNLNYDMIARDAADDSLGVRCGATITQAYPELREILARNNTGSSLGLDLNIRSSERPSGGSDFAPFAAKDVPVIAVMAAMHPDYHQPGDDVAKVNWKKMTAIIKLGYLTAWDISSKPGKLQSAPPAGKSAP
jgi:Zn-dependent M28 family amino/carboxypeptidase